MKPIVDLLMEIKELMNLKGENPFKVRAFEKAADTIEALGDKEDWVQRAKAGTLTEIPGIGKGISEVLREFLIEGKSSVRDELQASLPEGLIELTQVPGLGPKKALLLIEELGIKSLGELEYACRENRLLKLKGFGEKVQAKVLEGVQFLAQTKGQLKISDAFPVAEKVFPILKEALNEGRHPAGGALKISEAGALRRRLEVVSELEFLVETPHGTKAPEEIEKKLRTALTKEAFASAGSGGGLSLPVTFHFATPERFGYELAHHTGTPEHWKELGSPKPFDARTEEEFFSHLKIPFIAPEMREGRGEVKIAREGKLGDVLAWDGIQGVFHNHTIASDGSATMEEMVKAAIARGWRYIGISDHSKSAFYAQGLDEKALAAQEKEARTLQEKYPSIRIFWGVESDILADGELDYDEKWLKRFDFVVASIHSRFQMDRDVMTKRIVNALKNPYTKFLGHATGRILLGRKGYDLDMVQVIETAASKKVAIEINAHPSRLDIDWRWGGELRKNGCLVSVNPDAHEISGLDDVKYGVCVARKALLPKGLVVNAGTVAEVSQWLKK